MKGIRGLTALAGVLALSVAAVMATGAGAELAPCKIKGCTVQISYHGNISPSKLPRKDLAPVGVQVGAKIKTTDKSVPPKLAKMILDINSHGRFETKGLPLCPLGQLNNSSSARAKRVCGDAQVGNGNVTSRVKLPGQGEFSTNGPLLAFNGKYKGKPAIFAHVASTGQLTLTYVIIFVLKKGKGQFGTSLVADIPPIASGNGFISAFDLSLKRRYSFKGQKRSYVSASCPLPPDINIASFPLQKSTYIFEDGTKIEAVLKKTCKARG